MNNINKLLECKVEGLEVKEESKKIFQNIQFFYNSFSKELYNKKWIEISNKNLYFNRDILACYPNFLNNFQDILINVEEDYKNILEIIQNNIEYSKYGILWDVQTYKESMNSFYNQWHPMESNNSHRIYERYNLLYSEKNILKAYDNDPNCLSNITQGLLVPIFRLGNKEEYEQFEKNEISKITSSVERILYLFLKNELIPKFINENEDLKEKYQELFLKKNEIDIYFSSLISSDPEELKKILLDIDKIRVNLDSYDKSMICDPNGGHWDMYEDDSELYIKTYINSDESKIYARDPRLDIKKGGIIGIDFGTKSTVVVFQDDKNITLPMRISGTILNKEVEKSDYENPTIIEFKDIENFIKDYQGRTGRPVTKWEDVTVSHTAFNNLMQATAANDFYSIVSDLKQWTGSKKNKLLIRDKKGVEKLLNLYLELTEEDIDPIEIYAYYIGSYINNMRNGIYLEYFLSFPVTYEKAIREKILKSFEKGIKKSLPKTVLEDENIMKKFKVKHGANEPAAYAVCALQEYGFEPEDDEKIYYGVFDFGGGTLDFDFGIFKESEDIRYDYDIEHFGAGGDRYLGGENILKEMAFEIFKENLDSLRENKITFICPEWCNRFMGDETVVDNNGNSKLNTKLLIDKLRGVWEQNGEVLEEKQKLNLFTKEGTQLVGLELNIDIDKLEKLIYRKIEGGIKNFFVALEKAFKNYEYDKIYLLLAGNSSKHSLVREIFEKYIKEKEINIEILPALGTEEAYIKLEERGIKVDKEDRTRPTGKTGVAYGLLESTADSCIKIINQDEERNNEINFKYYIGYEKKKKLKLVLNPNVEYNSFNFFSYVKTNVFNIYYTTLPEASSETLLISEVKRERITLSFEYDSDTKIYIKAISPDIIEYAVTKKDINDKEILESGKVILS